MASIQKRTRKNGDGSTTVDYRVAYKAADGKWKRPSFASKREAEVFASSIGGDVIAGRHVANSDSITVADAAEAWLEACEKTGVGGKEPVEPHTLRDYKQTVRDHIVPLLGAIKMNKLTPARIVQFRIEPLPGAPVQRQCKARTGGKPLGQDWVNVRNAAQSSYSVFSGLQTLRNAGVDPL